MELGCFMAGLMFSIAGRDNHRRHRTISATENLNGNGLHHGANHSPAVGGHHKYEGHTGSPEAHATTKLLERLQELIEPVKDLFLAIYFASVGMKRRGG